MVIYVRFTPESRHRDGFGRLVEGAGQGREAEVVEVWGRVPKPL